MTRKTLCMVTLACVQCVPGFAHAQRGTNLDFELGRGDSDVVAQGWRTSGDGYEILIDTIAPHGGRYSILTRRVSGDAFGLVSQTVSIEGFGGGTVRLAGYIRTEAITNGYAGFWARVDGVQRGLAMDNMSDRGVSGDTPWTLYEIELPIADCGSTVVFGPIHPGDGTAWYDDITIETQHGDDPAGMPADCAPLSQELNLDFEQATAFPSGWLVERDPQGVAMDSTVLFSGRKSLQLVGHGDTAETRITHQLPLRRIAGNHVTVEGRVRGAGVLILRVQGRDSTIELRSEDQGTSPDSWSTHRLTLEVERCAAVGHIGVEHRGDGTAWFDRLELTIDGSEEPTGPSAAPADESGADRERLLTNVELEIEPDDCAPDENETWTSWARDNAQHLRSITSEDFADLQFLKQTIDDKRVVQLGESGHGVEQFNMVKTRLIKFLHEEMGFDVLAFESSFEECYHANRMRDDIDAVALRGNCIFGVWHTAEVIELFEYIKETSTTPRPLILAGFDTQTSSRLSATRPTRFKNLIARVDPSYADEVEAMDTKALARVRGGASNPVAPVSDSLVALYEELMLYLRDRADAIAASPDVAEADVLVAIQGAQSMIHFIRQQSEGTGLERTMARDSGMADNLDFLLDVLYPAKKVITWGHNFHIRHLNQEATPDPVKTMGAWTAERRRDEIYTVGLYMYRGEAALNNRQVYDVFRASSGSLESILHRTGVKYSFIDISHQTRSAGNEWMFTPITAKTWGRSDVTMTLRDQYDAILFIDTVKAPTYR